MPDLIAQGTRREDRWRRRVPPGVSILLGRSAGRWSASWDDHVSREHARIVLQDGKLHVHTLPGSKNPVFFQGKKRESFRVGLGQHFVIGQTTFTLSDESVNVAVHTRPPVTEQTFSHEYLRHLNFANPEDRLAIISRIPERVALAHGPMDLHEQMVRVIFEGIPIAAAVAVCQVAASDTSKVDFLHWDRTDNYPIDASRRLISKAVENQETVVNTWTDREPSLTESATASSEDFTQAENTTWAFCVPFDSSSGRSGSAKGLALYVAGSQTRAFSGTVHDLQEEMKFAEIVVSTIGSFYQVRELQRRQAALGQFFSAPVIAALEEGDAEETLTPREADVTVLFCDLRGFSRATEQSADDLLGLLQRVSDALGVLTQRILGEGGVIGDFHGDAAMGFWGWPLPQEDAAHRAARAALMILDEFRQFSESTSESTAFRIGVGIASGRVVAGKIGTTDQVKVTAFGPAVNLASRLESMTKLFNASVLIDETTAAMLATQKPSSANPDTSTPAEGNMDWRIRRLAVVKPYGLESSIDVHELLPPAKSYPLLSDDHVEFYEEALTAFVDGDWAKAWEKLHLVPAADPSKDFLTTYIASRNRTAPADWDGVIRLDSK